MKGKWIIFVANNTYFMQDYSCKVVFVDTDGMPARECNVGDLTQNEIEANLVRQV